MYRQFSKDEIVSSITPAAVEKTNTIGVSVSETNSERASKTSVVSMRQVNEIESQLNSVGIPHMFSKFSREDIKWDASEAGADGLIFPGTVDEILVYVRRGEYAGGSQNDRFRSMVSTANSNPNRRFVFFVDGNEVGGTYNTIMKALSVKPCNNALWATTNLIPQINFKTLSFKNKERKTIPNTTKIIQQHRIYEYKNGRLVVQNN